MAGEVFQLFFFMQRETESGTGKERKVLTLFSSLSRQDASCDFILLWIIFVCVRVCVVTFVWLSSFVVDLWEMCGKVNGPCVYPLQNDYNTKEAHNFIFYGIRDFEE